MKFFSETQPIDLPREKMRKEVFAIATPVIIELILVQLCTLVDITMVGKLGDWAIVAVTLTSQPKFVLLTIFMALNTGVTALIARFKGSGEKVEANETMRQSLLLSIILSVFISIFGYIYSRDMVIFMGAKEARIIDNATIYLQIQSLGIIFSGVTLSITAALRGIGRTKDSMVYNLVSNIINLIFNYCLIYGNFGFPEMGIKGASIATVLGQAIACVIAVSVLFEKDGYFHLKIKDLFVVNISILKRIIKIAIPSIAEQLTMRTGMIFFTKIVTTLSTQLIATHQIAGSILTFSFMNGQAFGISATALLGRSLGEKRVDYARAYTKECQRIAIMYSLVLVFLFSAFGKALMRLFIDDPYIIEEGAKVLLVVAALQPMQASQLVLSGALRGAGDVKLVTFITFIGILIVRPILSVLLVNYLHLGLMGAWIAMSFDQSIRFIFSYFRFRSNKWSKIKV